MKRDDKSVHKNIQSTTDEYSISRFHLVRHIFALIFSGGLLISLAMSEFTYNMHGSLNHLQHLKQFLGLYLLLLFFVGLIAITAILTVCKIKISQTEIEIQVIFWRQKIINTDWLSFDSSPNLKFACLRTKSMLYLLAKPEFKDWPRLEQTLRNHLAED